MADVAKDSSDDQDFDPTAEMLVNDFDDEHTLDEEEAMDNDTNGEEEIDDLHKEGEMPLEELLAMYGYNERERVSSVGVERVEATSTSTDSQNTSQSGDVHSPHLRSAHPFTHMNNQNMVSDSSSDEESSELSLLEEDWRRTIQVGSDYQASVPEGLQRYDGAPAYENEDRLIWDPKHLKDSDIEQYLLRFTNKSEDENGDTEVLSSPLRSLPTGAHIRDDEQALYLLHSCGHNIEEALRRRRTASNLPVINESMTLWSEEECKSFEAGIRMYGKDFHLIQINKVRTRSVGEIVQFYYLWKKTERHDVFATKFRVEKKKYSLHPGTTDYMDRFLDEQENLALTVQASLSSSFNNIQPSNKPALHSYRSSPSTQNSNKSDLLIDELSSPYGSMNSFCNSGGGGNGIMSAFVNGYYKASDNVLCSEVSGGNAVAKVCHSTTPVSSSEWLPTHQQSASSTTATSNGPDVNGEFMRRNVISTTNADSNHSLSSVTTNISSSNA